MPLKASSTHSDAMRKRVIQVMKFIISNHADIRTRSAFAKRIHTTPQAIFKWEKFTGHPTWENIIDICLEFLVSLEWIGFGTGKMFGDVELIHRLDELEKRMGNVELKTGIKSK